MNVVALTTDLMDRSRLSAAVPGIVCTADPAMVTDADVVVVDLARFGSAITDVRAATTARIVAYGPHVDDEAAAAARVAGADVVLPRSRFFRDPAASLSG